MNSGPNNFDEYFFEGNQEMESISLGSNKNCNIVFDSDLNYVDEI